jgi:hypothetical protein
VLFACNILEVLFLFLMLQEQHDAAAALDHDAGAGSAAAAGSEAAAAAAGPDAAAAAGRVSSEGGLDDDELAELANDPELDAYLQVSGDLYSSLDFWCVILGLGAPECSCCCVASVLVYKVFEKLLLCCLYVCKSNV